MNKNANIENVTFDEIKLGQTASLTRTLFEKDIELFAIISGDVNPAHLDKSYAKDSIFGGVIGHGMWSGALISSLLGTTLPGPGTIYLNQNLDFKKPVRPGEKITVTVSVKEKREHKKIVIFDCLCTNALGETVVSGTAVVIAPTKKMRGTRPALPDVHLYHQDRLRHLVNTCSECQPSRTAIIHPVNAIAIKAAIEAAQEKLIEPIFIGPESRIKAAAEEADLDISAFELIPTEHSHAAAAEGAKLAASGSVAAIMKGALSTDELLSAVLPSSVGLRTERRVSHAFVMDIPTYHKLLIITDAAINISPSLDDKADICRNAINLWKVIMGEPSLPKLAVLAATEKVKSDIQATLDAAALCKMSERGQISDVIMDGPLALDLAISRQAAQDKGITSEVAGDADILLAPDIHSGNMISKQLTFLGGATAAGLVLGLRIPIILTSRADSLRSRLASCALALQMARARQEGLVK